MTRWNVNDAMLASNASVIGDVKLTRIFMSIGGGGGTVFEALVLFAALARDHARRAYDEDVVPLVNHGHGVISLGSHLMCIEMPALLHANTLARLDRAHNDFVSALTTSARAHLSRQSAERALRVRLGIVGSRYSGDGGGGGDVATNVNEADVVDDVRRRRTLYHEASRILSGGNDDARSRLLAAAIREFEAAIFVATVIFVPGTARLADVVNTPLVCVPPDGAGRCRGVSTRLGRFVLGLYAAKSELSAAVPMPASLSVAYARFLCNVHDLAVVVGADDVAAENEAAGGDNDVDENDAQAVAAANARRADALLVLRRTRAAMLFPGMTDIGL